MNNKENDFYISKEEVDKLRLELKEKATTVFLLENRLETLRGLNHLLTAERDELKMQLNKYLQLGEEELVAPEGQQETEDLQKQYNELKEEYESCYDSLRNARKDEENYKKDLKELRDQCSILKAQNNHLDEILKIQNQLFEKYESTEETSRQVQERFLAFLNNIKNPNTTDTNS